MHQGTPSPGGPADREPPEQTEELFEDSLPPDVVPGEASPIELVHVPWTRRHREDLMREVLVRRFTTAFLVAAAGLFILIVAGFPTVMVEIWATAAVVTISTFVTIAIKYYFRSRH